MIDQKKVKILLVFFFTMVAAMPLTGQHIHKEFDHLFTTPLHYIIYTTNESLNIDGKPLESAWKQVPWSSWFKDIEGDKKPEPVYKTRFKMLWDADYFYVFAEMEEPHIWANLKEHDQVVYHDNDFEIFIDPSGDAHNYFEIEVNAFKTVFDLFLSKPYRSGGQALIPWNTDGLQVGVDIDGTLNDPSDTDNRWTVEMAIPFRTLSLGDQVHVPEDGSLWRINFSRVQWDTEIIDNVYHKKINPETGKPFPEHNWVWSPQGIINMHFPERWGYALFTTTEPGVSEVKFELPGSEKLKRHLWLSYYLQSKYFREHGKYATSFSALNHSPRVQHDQHHCNMIMEATSFQYQIVLQCNYLKESWQINHEGRVWKYHLKENP